MKARDLLEGGNAVPDVGTIHVSEVGPTVKNVAKLLGMPEVVDHVLGSVGKVEYSGDIDIAVNIPPEQMKEFSHKLRAKLGNQNVVGVGGIVSMKFPIANYDESKQGRLPRTGFVQVDLMPGNVPWLKTFYHSPGKDSKLKGLHRNVALASLAKHIDRKDSKELDSFERPVSMERWSWGPKGGLQHIRKLSKKNPKTGAWLKTQDTEFLSEPIFDADAAAKVLFRGKAGKDAMHSVETIVDAIKKAYKPAEQKAIFAEIAKAYRDFEIGEGYEIPKEIAQYI